MNQRTLEIKNIIRAKGPALIPNPVNGSRNQAGGITSGINEILESGIKNLAIILANVSAHLSHDI